MEVSSELKEKQLYILDLVDGLCKDMNLNYSLAGGTLLGAIRHKGYIPWDDDIDIMMPRDHYDILLKELKENYSPYDVFSNQEEENFFPFLFSKLSDSRTSLYKSGKALTIGVNIDIFPIDSLGDNKLIALSRFQLIRSLDAMVRIKRSQRKFGNKAFDFLFRVIQLALKPFSIKHCQKTIRGLCSNNKLSVNSYAVSIGSRYVGKEFTSAEIYCKYQMVNFEDRKYVAIADYDKYLSMMYGDYMKIPKKSERESHGYST